MSEFDLLAGDEDVLIGYEELVTAVGADNASAIMSQIEKKAPGARPRKVGMVRQAPYSKIGTRYVGIPQSLALAAGASVTVSVYATQAFNANRFVLPRTPAAALAITSWFIGDKTVLWSPATAPLPCDMFSPDSLSNDYIQLDTIDKNRGMDITFQNISAGPTDVRGGFIGTGAF